MDKGENGRLDKLKKLCNGDIDFMKEMINVFLRTSVESLNNIKSGFQNGDLEKVGNSAHKLKSSIQIIGDQELHLLVKKIEREARLGESNVDLNQAILQLDQAINNLNTYLSKSVKDPDYLL